MPSVTVTFYPGILGWERSIGCDGPVSADTLVENLYEEVRTTKEGQTFTKNDFKDKYDNANWKQMWKAIEHTAVGRGKHKFVHSIIFQQFFYAYLTNKTRKH